MFGHQFYPTPKEVIKVMLQPFMRELLDGSGHYLSLKYPVLDPSAGKGDILDAIIEVAYPNEYDRAHRTNSGRKSFYAVEIDPELRNILKSKKISVIGTDWLEYDEPCTFPSIIMNPPFDNAVKHIMKAWDKVAAGGVLVALLNYSSLVEVKHKENENLRQLVNLHGKWADLGCCFKEAERAANVKVACIWLHKPEELESAFAGFTNRTWDLQDIKIEDFAPAALSKRDVIADLVARYKMCVQLALEQRQKTIELNAYMKGIDGIYRKTSVVNTEMPEVNDVIFELKERFWSTFFTKTKIANRMTSNFKSKFDEFRNEQVMLDFSESNILEVVNMFIGCQDQIMKDCVLEVFDKIRRYYSGNNVHKEGWKTNKSAKINKKIIYPNCVSHKSGGAPRINWSDEEFFRDLDKALCFLSGCSFDDVNQADGSIVRAFHSQADSFDAKVSSKFFDIKVFHKGTMHLTFKDLELLEKLNKFVANNRNWIGVDS